jgi:toxin ParE1/3/4
MKRQVRLARYAVRDLDELFDYLVRYGTPGRADKVLAQVTAQLTTLATHPERGAYPAELLALGIRSYRELLAGPYRIVYQAGPRQVHVLVIADGRRDFQRLLQRRLLMD